METSLPKELVLQTEDQLHMDLADTQEGLQVQLKGIKVVKDRVEARKEAITKPLREALALMRDLFKPLELKLAEADGRVRNALLVLEEARLKEQARLAKKVEQGKVSVEESMALVSTEAKGLFRMVPKVKIVSLKDIPDRYWQLNESLIRQDLMSGKKVKGAILLREKIVVSK